MTEREERGVHYSPRQKPIKTEIDGDVPSRNLNDYISTRDNKTPIKSEFIERDVSSGNSNDCIPLHTEMDIKLEPTSFSDTECESEKVCYEIDIKTENLLVGEMPSSVTERKVKLYDGTDIKTEDPLLDKMPLNDTEIKEEVNDGTDTKTEIILLDGMQSNDTESKMTNAHGFDVSSFCKQSNTEFHVKSEPAQHTLVHGSTTGPERSTTTTGQRISDELYQASRSAVNTLQLPAASSNSRVQTNPTAAKTDFTESEPDTRFNTDLRSDTGETIIRTRSSTRVRNKRKPYKCNMCDFECTNSYYLQSHLATHSRDKPYKCKLCAYRGAQKSHLELHFRTHTTNPQEKSYKCDLCDYESSSSIGLSVHVRTHTRDKHKCKLCDYETERTQDLKLHYRIHLGDKPYKCKLCDYEGAKICHLKTHVRYSHSADDQFYKCNLCDFKTLTRSGLGLHLRGHRNKNIKFYKCSLCNYETKESRHFKRHYITHTGFKCDLCDYGTAKRSNLKVHFETIHEKNEKIYKCTFCNFKSANNLTVEEHIKTHYTCYKALQMF